MSDIKDFLKNNEQYPDNTPVKIGDTEVPLGSLRALNTEQRTQLETAIKENTARSAELEKQRASVLELAGKAQAAFDAAKTMSTRDNTPKENWRDDPWFKPVATDLDAASALIKTLQEENKKLTNSIASAASIWAEDRWDHEYESIDFGKREKKPTREELIKFATENNLLDRHKIPSVRKAWEKMSEGDRLADAVKAAEEKGREAGRMEAIAARLPQPGVPGPGAQLPNKQRIGPDTDILGDLWAEANKDPDLRPILENLPPGLM